MADPTRKHLTFDPTINLGHVLTALAMLSAGFGAYSALDRRLAIQEEKASHLEARSIEQEQRTKDTLQEIRADVKDVQRSVNDVSRNLQNRSNKP